MQASLCALVRHSSITCHCGDSRLILIASRDAKLNTRSVLAAACIFIGTYVVLAIGRLPGFRVDRTGAAIIGAGLMIAFNVPAVLMFKPLVPHLADPNRAWLILATASTLAGNLTVLGSVANLIVIQKARRHITISFWEYFKVGLPLTIATIAFGAWML